MLKAAVSQVMVILGCLHFGHLFPDSFLGTTIDMAIADISLKL